jgi:hypothetical protein
MRPPRSIRVEGEVAYVPLTRGLEAIIDASDIPLVEGKNWAALVRGRKVYAGRSVWNNGTNDCDLMHRTIAGAEPDILVDHIDGNGLNNRRGNLRPASRSQNAMNADAHSDSLSGIKGVHWSKQHGRWKAEICARGKRKHIGLYDTPTEAAAAYRAAAERLHGEFARVE